MNDSCIDTLIASKPAKYFKLKQLENRIDKIYTINIKPDLLMINIHKFFGGLESCFNAKEIDDFHILYCNVLYNYICKAFVIYGIDNKNKEDTINGILDLAKQSFTVDDKSLLNSLFYICNDEILINFIEYVISTVNKTIKDIDNFHDIFTLEDLTWYLKDNYIIYRKNVTNSIDIIKLRDVYE